MKRYAIRILLVTIIAFVMFLATAEVCTYAATDDDMVGITYLDKNVYYSPAKGRYVYVVPDVDNAEISCTVADKMIVNGPVSVEFNPIYPVVLYKDGSEIDADWNNITEPGSYIVKIKDGVMKSNIFSFTIIGQYTNIDNYVLQDDCELVICTLNAEEQFNNTREIEFNEEGIYYVEYKNTKSKVSHFFMTEVDHTAPTLKLEGVVNGRAKGAVSLADAEADAELFITLNGQYYVPNGNLLGEVGDYYVRITDPAGNSNEYLFEIIVSLDMYTILFLIVMIGIIAGLLTYLMIGRKKMKVR